MTPTECDNILTNYWSHLNWILLLTNIQVIFVNFMNLILFQWKKFRKYRIIWWDREKRNLWNHTSRNKTRNKQPRDDLNPRLIHWCEASDRNSDAPRTKVIILKYHSTDSLDRCFTPYPCKIHSFRIAASITGTAVADRNSQPSAGCCHVFPPTVRTENIPAWSGLELTWTALVTALC